MAKRTRFQPGKFKPEPKIGDLVTLRFDTSLPHQPGVIIRRNARYKNSADVFRDGQIETYLLSFLEKAS